MCHAYSKTYNIHVWFRTKEDLVLGVNEVAHLKTVKAKRQRIRKGRRGKPGERRQRIYELISEEEREKTLGATKVRRKIRAARKKGLQ